MKKVVVAAEVFSSNLGDYAIYDSLSSILEKQKIEVKALDLSLRRGWENDSALLEGQTPLMTPVKNVLKKLRFYRLFASRVKWYVSSRKKSYDYWKELISDCDAVIVGGGQLLTDTNRYFPLRISAVADIAKRLNKPIAFLGCGVGGELSRSGYKSYEEALLNAKYISLRDKGSGNKLREYARDRITFHISPDLAFALPDSDVSERATNRVCGFNVMPLSIFHRFVPELRDVSESEYLRFWRRLAEGAAKEGLDIVIMTNGNPEDFSQAERINYELKKGGFNVRLLDRPRRPEELYEQVKNVDYLIATRMHAGIIGYTLGCKVATISWDQKVPYVWEAVNKSEVVVEPQIIKDDAPWARIVGSFESIRAEIDPRKNARDVHDDVRTCLGSLGVL